MNARDFKFLLTGVVLVFFFKFIARPLFFSREKLEDPPSIGGQSIPKEMYAIDFNKRYNVRSGSYYGGDKNESYENVKILGFVGQ